MSECIPLPHPLRWKNPKFQLGPVYITPAAIVALTFNRVGPVAVLAKHITGDWSDLTEADQAANEQAIANGRRILSAYRLADGTQLSIVTEADRSSTTIMCADEK